MSRDSGGDATGDRALPEPTIAPFDLSRVSTPLPSTNSPLDTTANGQQEALASKMRVQVPHGSSLEDVANMMRSGGSVRSTDGKSLSQESMTHIEAARVGDSVLVTFDKESPLVQQLKLSDVMGLARQYVVERIRVVAVSEKRRGKQKANALKLPPDGAKVFTLRDARSGIVFKDVQLSDIVIFRVSKPAEPGTTNNAGDDGSSDSESSDSSGKYNSALSDDATTEDEEYQHRIKLMKKKKKQETRQSGSSDSDDDDDDTDDDDTDDEDTITSDDDDDTDDDEDTTTSDDDEDTKPDVVVPEGWELRKRTDAPGWEVVQTGPSLSSGFDEEAAVNRAGCVVGCPMQ